MSPNWTLFPIIAKQLESVKPKRGSTWIFLNDSNHLNRYIVLTESAFGHQHIFQHQVFQITTVKHIQCIGRATDHWFATAVQ